MTSQIQHKARDSLILLGLPYRPSKFIRIIERETTIYQPLSIRELRQVLVVRIKLILNFADNLLDDVLDGDDAGSSAVLVNCDNHLVTTCLHLGEQRNDVFGIRHVVRRTHEARDLLVTGVLIKHWLQQIFDVSDAHDAIDILVVDRDTRETRLAHDAKDLADSCSVLHGGHVNARDHNLADNGVAHLDDLVNHGFFFFGEVLGILDYVAKLFLGDLLAVIGGVNAHQRGNRICRGRRDEHEWTHNLHERLHRADDCFGHCLGVC